MALNDKGTNGSAKEHRWPFSHGKPAKCLDVCSERKKKTKNFILMVFLHTDALNLLVFPFLSVENMETCPPHRSPCVQ